jgi:hypothetical protein
MYEVSKREMLWKILKILGVPDNLIEVLKKLYTDVTINLRVGEKLVQSLSTSGVKQGDNLAPVLFIVVMEMRRCRWLSKLSAMEESRSPRRMLGAWCVTPRAAGWPQQTIRHAYTTTIKKLGFEEEKGQLRLLLEIDQHGGR